MRFPGFIGPSYRLQSPNVDCQRCVNLYPEIHEGGGGKEGEVAALVSTPGLRPLGAAGTGQGRALYTASNGQVFVVTGNKLYQLSSDWGATELGTLNTSTGPVSMSDNGIQLVIVDGTYGYAWTFATASFNYITDPDFPGADQVTFQDGFFLFNHPGTGQFFWSDLNSVDFDALDFQSAPGSPDPLVGILSNQRNIFLFGTQSTEIYYNTGIDNAPTTFLFERVQGAYVPIGTAANFSIASVLDTIYWLGQDKEGRGIVYRVQGYQPQRVSTFAVEEAISKLGDLSSARAWTYQTKGHSFYCLNLPGAETTWVYDAVANMWHERASLVNGALARHRAGCHAFAHNTNVVLDYENSNFYALDPDTFTDNGEPIVRERTSPHISSSLKDVFHGRFQLDIETGVGTATGQGQIPQAMLQWSDDGGHGWSNEHWAEIGRVGRRGERAVWRRLGSARDRVYRVRITDPVKVTLIGADLETEAGVS